MMRERERQRGREGKREEGRREAICNDTRGVGKGDARYYLLL